MPCHLLSPCTESLYSKGFWHLFPLPEIIAEASYQAGCVTMDTTDHCLQSSQVFESRDEALKQSFRGSNSAKECVHGIV